MIKPWEIAEQIRRAEHDGDQSSVLSGLAPTDPFWVGASYACDPFVGIICKLPIFDPKRFGSGAPARVFDKLVKGILDGTLKGEPLVIAIEAFSKACTDEEWSRWYRPILQGEMNLRLPLDVFNQFCPDGLRVPPPKLGKPRQIQSIQELPKRFFLQPSYKSERLFWFIDSKNPPHEIRGYDAQVRRFHDTHIEAMFRAFAGSKPVDIVVTGHANSDFFMADDLLSRDQFTQEMNQFPLYRRLEGLGQLGLPLVQMSDILSPDHLGLVLRELNLIFEQGYEGAVVRDMDAHYPFRNQPDFLIRPTVKATATVTEVVAGLGLRFEYTRGKKTYNGIVHLGLTKALLGDTSDLQGKRFELVSCGAKDGELLLPVFKKWS